MSTRLDCPALVNPNYDERNDGTDDEQSNHGHKTIEISPPSGTLVTRLIDLSNLTCEIQRRDSTMGWILLP